MDSNYGNRTFTSLKKGIVLTRVGRELVVSVGKVTITHFLNQQTLKPLVRLQANIHTSEFI